nr:hypothetical protein Iba_chr13fCG7290 [Ipomoea batatas]
MYPNLQLLAAVVSGRKRQLGPRQRRRLQLCRYGCVDVAFQHSTQVFHGSSAIGIWVDACVDHPTDHLKVFISEMLQLRIHQVRHCLRNLESKLFEVFQIAKLRGQPSSKPIGSKVSAKAQRRRKEKHEKPEERVHWWPKEVEGKCELSSFPTYLARTLVPLQRSRNEIAHHKQ